MAFSKWIGGAMGWAFGGPIGALLGFVFGSIMDRSETEEPRRINSDKNWRNDYEDHRHKTQEGDFISGLLILSAAVMKADGKHLKSELDVIKGFLVDQFGEQKAAEHVKILKELLNRDIPLRQVCSQISYFMEHSARLQVLHYLFKIADADGEIHRSEERVIQTIASHLRISQRDFYSIRAAFFQASPKRNYRSSDNAYKILGIDKSVTESELKKVYRSMAKKYHPDKLKGLGEAQMRAGEEKFIQVQKAYEQIKKEKGW